MVELLNIQENKWDDSHRPWPLPNYPWGMKQTWGDLLFAHYPIQYDVLRKLVPEGLELDSYDGVCWIGVVPFSMSGVRLRGLPPVPGTDEFPELNVRTYVMIDGKPGVYFFSLDADNWQAVKGARTFFHLPYHYAKMDIKNFGDTVLFESKRRDQTDIVFAARYKPVSEPFLAVKGSFEEWMSERYCFYTINASGVPVRCDILHHPWILQQTEGEITLNTMLSKQGIIVDNDRPILHFSKKIDVRAWPLVSPATGKLHF